MRELTHNQQIFVHEYLKDFDAQRAASDAGYHPTTGYTLLRQDHIVEAIAEGKYKQLRRIDIDADYVLRRLVLIDQMDVLDIIDDQGYILPLKQWPKIWRQYISNFKLGLDRYGRVSLSQIKWPDKIKNLELLGKHCAVGAFSNDFQSTINGDLEVKVIREIIDPVKLDAPED